MFNYVHNGLMVAHKDNVDADENTTFASHMHNDFELIYFVSGEVDYTVEHNTQHLNEGDFILIAPGKYHNASVNSSVPYDRYVFRFPTQMVTKELYDLLITKEPFFTGCQKIGMFATYFDLYYDKYSGTILDTLIMGEMLKILGLICYATSTYPLNSAGMVDEIIRYVNVNIHKPMTLDDIAAHCRVSKPIVGVEFKKAVGVTLMKYVAIKRALATTQAIASGMRKAEAARAFGYQDYSTFYRGYQRLKNEDYKKSIVDELI